MRTACASSATVFAGAANKLRLPEAFQVRRRVRHGELPAVPNHAQEARANAASAACSAGITQCERDAGAVHGVRSTASSRTWAPPRSCHHGGKMIAGEVLCARSQANQRASGRTHLDPYHPERSAQRGSRRIPSGVSQRAVRSALPPGLPIPDVRVAARSQRARHGRVL